MDFRDYLLIAALFVNTALGLIVAWRASSREVRFSFAYFVISIDLWTFGLLIFRNVASVSDAYFWNQLFIWSAGFIAASFLHFCVIFPYSRRPIPYYAKFAIYIPAFLVLYFSYRPGILIQGIVDRSWGRESILGPGYIFFAAYFSIYTVISFMLLITKLRESSGIKRTQILYVLIGMLISFGFGAYFNLLLILLGNYRLVWVGPNSIFIMVATITYAIVAHRLFDIRVIIKRTVIFAGLSAFVLGTYALIIFLSASLLGGQGAAAFEAKTLIPNFVAALGIALGFEPLRRWLTTKTDNWLFKGEYVAQDVLRELADTLANVVDLSEAVEGMMQIVTKAMRLTKSAAFLLQPGEAKDELELKQVVTVGMRSEGLKLAPKDSLIEYFRSSEISHDGLKPVVVEELRRQMDEHGLSEANKKLTEDFVTRLSKLGGAVSLPLFIKRQQPVPTAPGSPPRFQEVDTFIGVLVLGEKKSGDAFSDDDLNLLQIVASQTAGAVEKSRLFEEDQLKSEFVAVASHELLTPTAAMEGYLSMILDEGMGKVDKQAKGYLTTVYSEAKRLASLVKDLLNVSRIERGKIVINAQPMDIMECIHQVENSLVFKAKERNMHMEIAEPKTKLPKVMADSEKMTEVLVNLVGNSIKYTPEGGHIWVSTELKGSMVLVRVKDDGIGLKPEDAQHLFSKFFRASNSDQTGQTGTGLGLYITKNIIELQGGTIGVESALNKGSTFTFSLPIVK